MSDKIETRPKDEPRTLSDEDIETIYVSQLHGTGALGDPDSSDVDPESADDDTED